MSKHLDRDLEHLKKELLMMGALVEEQLSKAVTSLVERRDDLVDEILEGDEDIDHREVVVEEDCLKMLALHQPVAADLRFIVTIMKVNSDLERMGDHAVNIAERARYLSRRPALKLTVNLSAMVRYVQLMVRESLDALVNRDPKLARRVCLDDAFVDEQNKQMHRDLIAQMKASPDIVEPASDMLSVSKQLERVADLATNIAEDVVFMVEGELIRHRTSSSIAAGSPPDTLRA
jgi:phosphate transport system protein